VFGLVIGFIEHLQIVTTSNYSAIASSHTLQFTTARTESSQSAVSSPVDVPGLTSSQAGGHLTPTSYSSVCRFRPFS
jgi:hypothetical protein